MSCFLSLVSDLSEKYTSIRKKARIKNVGIQTKTVSSKQGVKNGSVVFHVMVVF